MVRETVSGTVFIILVSFSCNRYRTPVLHPSENVKQNKTELEELTSRYLVIVIMRKLAGVGLAFDLDDDRTLGLGFEPLVHLGTG